MHTPMERGREFSAYHPIINLLYFVGVIGITMFTMNPFFLLLTFLFSWVYSFILFGKRTVKYNLLFFVPVFIFMVIINPLFHNNGVTILFYINGNRVTLEAVLFGFAVCILFLSVVVWFRCAGVLLTSDKLIYLFGRIAPVFALVFSMVVRFIPLLQRRYQVIAYGQDGMGKSRKKEALRAKCRRIVKQISILIAWSLETSIETADSMEARGYGCKGRTSFHLYRFQKRDAGLLVYITLLIAITLIGCVSDRMDIAYYPAITFPNVDRFTYVFMISYSLLLSLPIMIEVEGARRWKQYGLNM